jgi:hypothetical protein
MLSTFGGRIIERFRGAVSVTRGVQKPCRPKSTTPPSRFLKPVRVDVLDIVGTGDGDAEVGILDFGDAIQFREMKASLRAPIQVGWVS